MCEASCTLSPKTYPNESQFRVHIVSQTHLWSGPTKTNCFHKKKKEKSIIRYKENRCRSKTNIEKTQKYSHRNKRNRKTRIEKYQSRTRNIIHISVLRQPPATSVTECPLRVRLFARCRASAASIAFAITDSHHHCATAVTAAAADPNDTRAHDASNTAAAAARDVRRGVSPARDVAAAGDSDGRRAVRANVRHAQPDSRDAAVASG